jgi:hypothetical protein
MLQHIEYVVSDVIMLKQAWEKRFAANNFCRTVQVGMVDFLLPICDETDHIASNETYCVNPQAMSF